MSDDDKKQYRFMEFRFDEGRLKRAEDIVVISFDEGLEKLPEHHYMAVGGDSQHYLHTKPHLDCDCRDFAVVTDRLCKHLIAALQYEENPVFMQAIEGYETPKEITVVAGPPAAGKTSYVLGHMEEGDIVWDWDRVNRALHLDTKGLSVAVTDIIRKMRDAFLLEVLAQKKSGKLMEDVWIIWSLPNHNTRRKLAEELGAEIVVLETPAEQCEINEKERSNEVEAVRTLRDANRWWDSYTQRPEDLIVQWEDQ